MMKQLTSRLFILLLFAACSQQTSEKYTGKVEDIFSDIAVSEELNLYVDETGQPADGHYSSTYQNGAMQADVTFRDGMISEGKIFSKEGVLTTRYTTENGLMKTSYHNTSNSQPRMVTLHGEDLEDQVEFHTWDQDGTQRTKHVQTVLQGWHENGQPQFKMQLKDGKLYGESTLWYENGQIKSEEHYINDVKHGTSRKWDKEGNLISNQVYNMGKLVTEE